MIRLLSAALFAGTLTGSAQPALTTVDHVDLNRYAGKWYELARMPNRFEKKCDRDVTATYRLEGDTVRVENRCIKADGSETLAKGKAKIVDSATNAKLKVTFFWPFYGDYWIIGLDPDYKWAVVGTPRRDYLWILSRTPSLPASEMERVHRVMEERGYKRQDLMPTKQTAATK